MPVMLYKRKVELVVIDCAVATMVAYICMWLLGKTVPSLVVPDRVQHVLLVVVSLLIARIALRIYMRVWRYATTPDYIRLVCADACACILYLTLERICFDMFTNLFVSLVVFLSICMATLGTRLFYRYYWDRRSVSPHKMAQIALAEEPRPIGGNAMHTTPENRIRIAIVGAGQTGVMLAQSLRSNPHSIYEPYCFIDKDPSKIGGLICNMRVYPEQADVVGQIHSLPVQEIVIALPNLQGEEKRLLFEHYAQTGCRVKLYDYPLGNLYNEKGNRVLREFRIEDLLFRNTITIDNQSALRVYRGKTILVTGAGGSIGSELCRQLCRFYPKTLVLLDIYENSVYDVQQELIANYTDKHTGILPFNLHIEVCSVTDATSMEVVFQTYRPDIVFHAAAHKHVPLMEHNPAEAIRNNVFGTYTTARLADAYGVDRFLLVSTDKAVNPTNVMGASKRLCEMIVESMRESKTRFMAVRFGNVLGSNGSVIPLFTRQIRNGGPVTITDKRIIRYFMSIPEAAQLLLAACSMAASGEIFVLDMGNPVRILDMAQSMIRMSGLTPYVDIDIVEVGLRPGEKLYEELLIKTETLDRTRNELIFIERDKPLLPEQLAEKLEILRAALASPGDTQEVLNAIRKTVPTYRSPEEVNAKAELAEEMRRVSQSGDACGQIA